MYQLTHQELYQVQGGSGLTGALLNGISRFYKTLHDVGRSLGSSLRRIFTGNCCY